MRSQDQYQHDDDCHCSIKFIPVPIAASAVPPTLPCPPTYQCVCFTPSSSTSGQAIPIPRGFRTLLVMASGAGGAGGNSNGCTAVECASGSSLFVHSCVGCGGGGSGAGLIALVPLCNLPAGSTYTVTVGTGGRTVAGENGEAGAATQIAIGTYTVTLGGGGGGLQPTIVNPGGKGGTPGTVAMSGSTIAGTTFLVCSDGLSGETGAIGGTLFFNCEVCSGGAEMVNACVGSQGRGGNGAASLLNLSCLPASSTCPTGNLAGNPGAGSQGAVQAALDCSDAGTKTIPCQPPSTSDGFAPMATMPGAGGAGGVILLDPTLPTCPAGDGADGIVHLCFIT